MCTIPGTCGMTRTVRTLPQARAWVGANCGAAAGWFPLRAGRLPPIRWPPRASNGSATLLGAEQVGACSVFAGAVEWDFEEVSAAVVLGPASAHA